LPEAKKSDFSEKKSLPDLGNRVIISQSIKVQVEPIKNVTDYKKYLEKYATNIRTI